MTNNNEALIESHRSITDNIKALKAERSKIAKDLLSAGIEADEQIKSALELKLTKAQEVAKTLADTLAAAEVTKAALDKRIDAGDDSVTPLEAMEADMAVRTTKGKQKPANEAVRKADRAVEPFRADNHLALLAADTIEGLVDVPVLVRKRPGDVRRITDAVILSQTEPTKGYGTVNASGRVRFTELGTTGLNVAALESALRDTGAEVNVYGDLIDYETAHWPVTRLIQPSRAAVVEFADTLARVFQATVEGPTLNRGYTTYETLWNTIEASLDVTEPGVAGGKVVADFGIDKEFPPTEQMRGFISEALSHFDTGVQTSAGVLESVELVSVVEDGKWVRDEFYMPGRAYPGRFKVVVDLRYVYEPVEVAK